MVFQSLIHLRSSQELKEVNPTLTPNMDSQDSLQDSIHILQDKSSEDLKQLLDFIHHHHKSTLINQWLYKMATTQFSHKGSLVRS